MIKRIQNYPVGKELILKTPKAPITTAADDKFCDISIVCCWVFFAFFCLLFEKISLKNVRELSAITQNIKTLLFEGSDKI